MIVSLQNKNILISGASAGIGRACAIECNRAGANIHLLGRDRERLKYSYDQLSGEGNSYHILDLLDYQKYPETISAIVESHGKIDGFIHSAGVQIMVPLRSMTVSQYYETFAVNTVSAFEISRLLARKKNHRESGLKIVFIASVMSVVGSPGISAYCSSKAALVGGARSMAIELAPKNILVNCVSPGSIADTDINNLRTKLTEEDLASIVNEHPLGLGYTDDVSSLCVYLLSEKAKWITGQNIIVDGGYSAK